MKIIVDLDGIVVDHTTSWFGYYNAEYGDKLTNADIKEWNTSLFVKPECGVKIFDYLAIPGFFEDLPALPGAIAALKMLQEDGHEVVICSATDIPEAAKGKMIWVRKYLPFLPKENLILTHGKYHVRGDILIDDSPHNIRKYREEYGDRVHIIAIAYPYNDSVDEICTRVGSYKYPELAWMKILRHIAKIEEETLW